MQLNHYFHDPVVLGTVQAGIVSLFVLAFMLLARRENVRLERETVVALLRGYIQVAAVGAVLLGLLKGPWWTSIPVLLLMIGVAASIAGRRAKGIPGALRVSFIGIAVGSGLVIVPMTAIGVIDPAISSLIPIGSMLIANAMNSSALALERFRAAVVAHQGFVEAGLALGAPPSHAVAPYVQEAVQASLIPRIDTLRSLGIVWIPGMMAGMVLAGKDPVYAGIYQFALLAMIFASSGIASMVCTLLIRAQVFTPAEQLSLR